MWGNKTPKSETLDSPNIRIVSDHSEDDFINSLVEGGTYASIDPAQKNYTLRFERRPAFTHRKKDIKGLEFCKIDIFSESEKNNKFITISLNDFLSSYDFSRIKAVLIERQMVENYKSTWLAHHTYAFLTIKYPKLIVVEIASTMKTKVLKAPPGLNKNYIKKWAVEKALEILKKREDENSIEYIMCDNKQDDKADTVIQLEALCVYYARLGYDVFTTRDLKKK